jgi:hypothetical protein
MSGNLNPLSSNPQLVNYSFGKPSQFIAGVQKLVQRYLVSLMNTNLVPQLIGSSASNIQTANTIFNTCNWSVVQTFRANQNLNLNAPTDEQLDTVQLTATSSSTANSINFSLQLTTAAGSSVTFILPLPLA